MSNCSPDNIDAKQLIGLEFYMLLVNDISLLFMLLFHVIIYTRTVFLHCWLCISIVCDNMFFIVYVHIQAGKTPLDEAIHQDWSSTVYWFVKHHNVDPSHYNQVRL